MYRIEQVGNDGDNTVHVEFFCDSVVENPPNHVMTTVYDSVFSIPAPQLIS